MSETTVAAEKSKHRPDAATGQVPTVSIGLAVRNGERYLREALDSILAQTFTDFELIICDNASTDGTEAICRAYATRDSRIRYHRNARNIGGANNENLTFKLSHGKYFRWAAHDDVLAPTLLERCVEVLDREPDVVLVHTGVIVIDEHGNETGRVLRNRPRGMTGSRLFADIIPPVTYCEETYGVMRATALRRTGLQKNYTDSDRTLLAHMALLGDYREVEDYLFLKRFHPQNSTTMYPEWRQRMAWFGDDDYHRLLPYWRQWIHYFQIALGPFDTISTKVRVSTTVAIWPVHNRRWRSLGKDLIIYARMCLRDSLVDMRLKV